MKDKNGKPFNRIRWWYWIVFAAGILFLNSWVGWVMLIALLIECVDAILLDAKIVEEEK